MASLFIGAAQCDPTTGPVVVIDVFRAFSVAPLALQRGARKVVLVGTREEALRLKARTPGSVAITDGALTEGFDLPNSPGAVLEEDLVGRTVLQCTNAGTKAALAVPGCGDLFCASFVCASATANQVRAMSESATYVISGDGGLANEDLACARYIDSLVRRKRSDPTPYLREARRSRAARDLREGLRRGYKGIHREDIDLCLQVDQVAFACTASTDGGTILLQPDRDGGRAA